MGSNFVAIVLVTVSTLLTTARAPNPIVSANSFASSTASGTLDTVNIAARYSIRNALHVHNGCYRWCWFHPKKIERESCKRMKQDECKNLKTFSYKYFIVFQLSRCGLKGLGNMAASVLKVPGTVVTAGLQVGTKAVATLGKGALAAGQGLGKGAVAAGQGLGKGAVAAGNVAGASAVAVANGAGATATVVGKGGVAVAQGTAKVTLEAVKVTGNTAGKSVNMLGDGAKFAGGAGVQGVQLVGSGLGRLGKAPSRMFSKGSNGGQ